MIRARCPKCRKLMALEADQEGRLAMCPFCDAKFRVPKKADAGSRPAAATAPTAPAAAKTSDLPIPLKPLDPTPPVDADFAPYLVQKQEDAGPPPGDEEYVARLNQENKRKRERDAAWALVGPPAYYIKLFTGIVLILEILGYAYLFTELTLYNHVLGMQEREILEEIEQAKRTTAQQKGAFNQLASVFKVNTTFPQVTPTKLKEREPVRYIWLLDHHRVKGNPPSLVFLMLLGFFLFRVASAIVVFAGVEKMKSLDSYTWAMVGAIALILGYGVYCSTCGILTLVNTEFPDLFEYLYMALHLGVYGVGGILLGVWALLVCNNPRVRKEWGLDAAQLSKLAETVDDDEKVKDDEEEEEED